MNLNKDWMIKNESAKAQTQTQTHNQIRAWSAENEKFDAVARPTLSQIFSIHLNFLPLPFPLRFLSHFILRLLYSLSFACFWYFNVCVSLLYRSSGLELRLCNTPPRPIT
jgi:hypothetical protein